MDGLYSNDANCTVQQDKKTGPCRFSITENQTDLDVRSYYYKTGTLSMEVVHESSQQHHATDVVTSYKLKKDC